MTPAPLLVAHRSGNTAASARRDSARADAIELDVHVHRRRVVVRHEKILWPSSRLWERWRLLPAGTRVPEIAEILAAVDDDTLLLVDLKCFTTWAARRIRRSIPADRPLIVSARSWWVLRAFGDRPETTALRSCGNRLQLEVVRRLPGLGGRLGVVAHERLLTSATVEALARRTGHLFTWAVPGPERASALADAGITGLIVDDLDQDWPRAGSPPGTGPG